MPRHQENASGKGVCQKALFVKLRDDQWTCVSVCGLKMLRGSKVVNFTRSSRCNLCAAGCLISNLVSALRPVLVACLFRLLLVRHAACFPSLQMLFSCWFSTSTARSWITHTVCENSRNSQSKHSPELLDVNEATRVLQAWSVLHLCLAPRGHCGSQACGTLSTSIITLPGTLHEMVWKVLLAFKLAIVSSDCEVPARSNQLLQTNAASHNVRRTSPIFHFDDTKMWGLDKNLSWRVSKSDCKLQFPSIENASRKIESRLSLGVCLTPWTPLQRWRLDLALPASHGRTHPGANPSMIPLPETLQEVFPFGKWFVVSRPGWARCPGMQDFDHGRDGPFLINLWCSGSHAAVLDAEFNVEAVSKIQLEGVEGAWWDNAISDVRLWPSGDGEIIVTWNLTTFRNVLCILLYSISFYGILRHFFLWTSDFASECGRARRACFLQFVSFSTCIILWGQLFALSFSWGLPHSHGKTLRERCRRCSQRLDRSTWSETSRELS